MAESFTLLTVEQLRDQMLRTWQQAMMDRGIDEPDISAGTEIFIKFTSVATAILSAQRDFIVKDKQRMPDTATGDDLLRFCTLYGLTPKVGAGSSGYFTFVTSVASAAIATGAELVDDLGQRYRVTTGGTYADEDRIAIEAISLGEATNLAEGARLRWLSPPAGAASKVFVYTGGLTGGAEAETEGALSKRLRETIAAKPGSGNWALVNSIAEDSDPSIQKAFCYPAYVGPNSLRVTLVQAPTSTNRDRHVSTAIILTAEAALIAELPGWVDVVVTSVDEVDSNVSIGMELADGQWVNDEPFPVRASVGYVALTVKTNDSAFRVVADAPPIAGVSAICWVPSNSQTLKRATVASYTTVTTNTYDLILDAPLTGIAVGDWIFPDAQRMEDYVEALFTTFAQLGPSELTASRSKYAGLFPRALRKPSTGQDWPSDIGPTILKFLNEVGPEVLDLDWLYRLYTSPDDVLPALLLTDDPRILTLGKLSFYPLS